MNKKIVLAYSGGVDTTYILVKLKEEGAEEVIAYCADVGQNEDIKKVRDRAYKAGAAKVYVEDLQEEFISRYVFPAIRANAIYENKYYLATALSRPLIAEKLVQIAREEKAGAIAHGCTGKGNDQVRFEIIYRTLGKGLEIIAPMRDWDFISRENEIGYLLKKRIPVDVTKKNPYSYDRNLWGVSIECGVLEDPEKAPPEDAYIFGNRYKKGSTGIKIGFKNGVPVSLNGKFLSGLRIIETLNKLGGEYRIGRADLVENRVVGIKSREIYEAPAAEIIYAAKEALEEMTLDKDTLHFKTLLAQKYSDMVYEGRTISPLFNYLNNFFSIISKRIEGEVILSLSDKKAEVLGRKSPNSLYSEALATYTDKDIFDRKASAGFIKIISQQYVKK